MAAVYAGSNVPANVRQTSSMILIIINLRMSAFGSKLGRGEAGEGGYAFRFPEELRHEFGCLDGEVFFVWN